MGIGGANCYSLKNDFKFSGLGNSTGYAGSGIFFKNKKAY